MKFLKGFFGNLSDLQKRILFTLGALIVYRIGSFIPLPGVNASAVLHLFQGDNGMMGIVSKADFTPLANGIIFDKISVKEVMSKEVVAVSSSDRLIHARRQMLDYKVGRVPVIDDDELIGIITSKDLMRAFINFRKNVPEKHQKSQIKG